MNDLSNTFPGRAVYDDQNYRSRANHQGRVLHRPKARAGKTFDLFIVFRPRSNSFVFVASVLEDEDNHFFTLLHFATNTLCIE